jgi:hypothetical protein
MHPEYPALVFETVLNSAVIVCMLTLVIAAVRLKFLYRGRKDPADYTQHICRLIEVENLRQARKKISEVKFGSDLVVDAMRLALNAVDSDHQIEMSHSSAMKAVHSSGEGVGLGVNALKFTFLIVGPVGVIAWVLLLLFVQVNAVWMLCSIIALIVSYLCALYLTAKNHAYRTLLLVGVDEVRDALYSRK